MHTCTCRYTYVSTWVSTPLYTTICVCMYIQNHKNSIIVALKKPPVKTACTRFSCILYNERNTTMWHTCIHNFPRTGNTCMYQDLYAVYKHLVNVKVFDRVMRQHGESKKQKNKNLTMQHLKYTPYQEDRRNALWRLHHWNPLLQDLMAEQEFVTGGNAELGFRESALRCAYIFCSVLHKYIHMYIHVLCFTQI